MCIIAVKSQNSKHPTEECLRAMWNKNPDGAGFAYPNVEGGISVIKGLMTYDKFREAIDPLLKIEGQFYIIHFRIGTHGSAGPENTHPFWIQDGKVALAHNGILAYSALVSRTDGRSDTSAFTEDILQKLPDNWWRQKEWQHLVEAYLGSYNKFAVIDKLGVMLFNVNNWTEDKETGLWFSNTGFRTYSSSVAGGSQAQNFRQPTSQASGNTGASTNNPRTYHEKRREAVKKYGQRIGSMVAAGSLLVEEATALKRQVDVFQDWTPEEGEDFLDAFQEYLDAAGNRENRVTIQEVMKLIGAEKLSDVPDFLAALNGTVPGIIDEEDDTRILQFPKSDFTSENTKLFVGKRVTIKMIGGTKRCGIVMEAQEKGISYAIAGGGTGYVSYHVIDEISTCLTLVAPHMKDLQRHQGCQVSVETLKKSEAFSGRLSGVGPKGFTVTCDMGIQITAEYEEVLSVTITEDPEPKSAAATT